MTAEQLLHSLGLRDLSLDAQGCARVLFDNRLEVNFESDEDSSQLHLYSVLMPLPPQGRESLYGLLLEGNLFGSETAGATLAVDPESEEVVLCRSVSVKDLSGEAFVQVVEHFVQAVEQWTDKLAQHTQASTSAEGTADTAAEAGTNQALLRDPAFLMLFA